MIFAGAAMNVTGSKHLIEVNGKRLLLDCGLFQGHRKNSEILNRNFPFAAHMIDAVVLSHAHIDHAGLLPLLVKNGFTGQIFCTHATRDLCSIMLPDSAYIQEKDFEWLREKEKAVVGAPLYTIADATRAMTHFRSVAYGQSFSPVDGVKVRFMEAGHVLGSALVELEIDDRDTGHHVRLGFTGDLGRADLPILNDPGQLENLDIFISESTYGNRLHDDLIEIEDDVAKEINEVHARGGKIIIPAFAVGRTQEVLYVLRQLILKGKIPAIPTFVDSPLAQKATDIFRIHPEIFDAEMALMLQSGKDPFCDGCDGVQFTRSLEESKSLNHFPGSCIIISASGMCEAGRIRHHLKNHITDPNNMVLVVGFMAQNTLGRNIVEKKNPIKIFGDEFALNATVANFRAFSGHADQTGLLNFSSKVGSPSDMFLVHGELEPMMTYKAELQKRDNLHKTEITIPKPGQIFELGQDKKLHKLNYENEVASTYCDLLECELPMDVPPTTSV